MNRPFFDANLLFAAAHSPNGNIAYLVRIVLESRHKVAALTCQQAIDEAQRNLMVKAPGALAAFERNLACFEVHPTVLGTGCELDLPRDDAGIYHAALASRATHLLTGDRRHFGPYMNRPHVSRSLVIQSAADYLRGLDQHRMDVGDFIAEPKTRYGLKAKKKTRPARSSKK